MGFSPLRHPELLSIVAFRRKAAFPEASPLAWDPTALKQAVRYLRERNASAPKRPRFWAMPLRGLKFFPHAPIVKQEEE